MVMVLPFFTSAPVPETVVIGRVIPEEGWESQPLYDYLARRGSFVDLDNYKPEYLPILSRDVLKRIASGDDAWETQVPNAVTDLIKKRGFFDYQRPDY